jgi:hypothetical protein
MLRDPFLTDQPTGSKATAIPWLESSTPEPTPPPVPTPEPTPEASPEPSPESTPTEIPILEVELQPEPNAEPDSIEEDPREVLAGSLLRVKINLDEVKAGTVNSDPPRSSWIQQLLALIGRS